MFRTQLFGGAETWTATLAFHHQAQARRRGGGRSSTPSAWLFRWKDAAMNCFQIEVDGIRHQGSWLRLGDIVEVRSPYGRTTMALDGRDAPSVAREVLRRLARPGEASVSMGVG
jgi:hypothetical protein